ncbi:hypothetical protein [Ktedonospora formicarum]|uniref:hypothetical protein n=1 Tax=Ktedonospora formicarum TaxID=2778364 RepID=UPI001C691512|nr:hypothetical protein [Ktedonospora formicarum]
MLLSTRDGQLQASAELLTNEEQNCSPTMRGRSLPPMAREKLATTLVSGSWFRFWRDLSLKDTVWLNGCVLWVERPHAADTKRDPKISWLV